MPNLIKLVQPRAFNSTVKIPLESIIRQKERKIVDLPYEKAYCLSKRGKTIAESQSKEISYSSIKGQTSQPFVFFHNHPSGPAKAELKLSWTGKIIGYTCTAGGNHLSKQDWKTAINRDLCCEMRSICKQTKHIASFKKLQPISAEQKKTALLFLEKLDTIVASGAVLKKQNRKIFSAFKQSNNLNNQKLLTEALSNNAQSYYDKIYRRAYTKLAKYLGGLYLGSTLK